MILFLLSAFPLASNDNTIFLSLNFLETEFNLAS